MTWGKKGLILSLLVLAGPTYAAESPASGHYLFAWAGDVAHKGNDFLAVIDADPQSTSYGQLITTAVTDQMSMQVHHTEYVMPDGGLLFANDHLAGRTFVFNVQDPLHPTVSTSFTDMAGYAHPHSFLRLPNGHVLASFQHMQHDGGAMKSVSGGLVEIDDAGHVIRAASSADPAFPDALLMPYSLVPLPEIDRVVVTNSSMHNEDAHGHTFQVWRLSDLKLLKTVYFDTGGRRYGDIDPEEPRRGPDGSVYVQTLACGIERITDIGTPDPKSKLVHVFPGSFCGVPTIVSHYLIQSDPLTHGLIVLDIANPYRPVEVSRLFIEDDFFAHWTGWDPRTKRLVVTGGNVHRLFMVKLDEATGIVSMDTAFHDADGKPGFSFDNRQWPHGWTGSAIPHGVVFSRQ
jgi:56kDa selenium binding protein (SBP56)